MIIISSLYKSQTMYFFPRQIRKSSPASGMTVILVTPSGDILDLFISFNLSPMTLHCHQFCTDCLASADSFLSDVSKTIPFSSPASPPHILVQVQVLITSPLDDCRLSCSCPFCSHHRPHNHHTHTHQQTPNPPISKQYLEMLSFLKSCHYTEALTDSHYTTSNLSSFINYWTFIKCLIYLSRVFITWLPVFPTCLPSPPRR